MDYAPDAGPLSIAPPGWNPPPAPPVAIVPVSADAADDPDAAVRSRISAAIIDNILVYGIYLGLCALLHWRVADAGHLLVFVAAGLLYHFVMEARDGQTIGKRQYGIRVVSADGSRADVRAIALRSVLRIIDQLPVMYVSGLVNMLRTGPSRRQRIGDVAGGTIVVADDRQFGKSTPAWMLPTATILAVLVSAGTLYAVLNAGNQPLSSAQAASFVAGCNRSTGGQVIDCGCFLGQLETAGYDTMNSLTGLTSQVEEEIRAGDPAAHSSPLARAALACRR